MGTISPVYGMSMVDEELQGFLALRATHGAFESHDSHYHLRATGAMVTEG